MTNFAGRRCRHSRTRTTFTAVLKLFTVFIVWLSLLSTAQAGGPKKTPRGQSQTFDFSLSSAGDQSVYTGSSVMDTITGTLLSGSTRQISFSVAGLPSGATGSFSQTACNLNCSSILTVGTTAATSGGTFPITVTATGGGVTKTTAFLLTVLTVTTLTNSPVSAPSASTAASTSSNLSNTSTTTSTDTSSVLALTSSTSSTGTVYYVATNGSDSNSCAQAQNISTPKLTIAAGIACLAANPLNNRVEIRGGTYAVGVGGNGYQWPVGTSWNNAPVIAAYAGE